jgi:Lon-like protease
VRHRKPGRWARATFFGVSAALIAWASVSVPLPFVEYVPGRPTPIPPLVEIEGTPVTELDGETAILTVLLREQPTLASIAVLLDDQRSLLPTDQVYPQEVDRQRYLELERERFGRQFELAAAVGAQAAGAETELVTEVVVVEVIVGSPAHGELTPGDVVLAIDDEPIGSAEEVVAAISELEEGEAATLTVLHEGEARDVEIAPEIFEGSEGEPRLGVLIQTAVDELRLPFDIRLAEETRIGGPSAGLIVGVTVYDLLSDEDLLGGLTVVGTGTLDADGRVGSVGGVPSKMRAAADYGADLVLVPELQFDQARAAAPDDLEVVGVTVLDEALDAIRDARDRAEDD